MVIALPQKSSLTRRKKLGKRKTAKAAKEVAKKPAKREKREKRETAEAAKKVAKKIAENVVLIGRKPVMNYVVACLTFFNAGENEVVVKARGRAISTAVDTIELLRRAFVKDLGLKSIEIGTEEITRETGQTSNVSTIEITVGKDKPK